MRIEIAKARYLLTTHAPYLATVLYSLNPIETQDVPIAAVDRHGNLYYNPELSRYRPEEVAGVLEHEIWHLLRLHFDRLKNIPQHDANIAADLEINDHTVMPLPNEALKPALFGLQDGLLAEEYVRLLQAKGVQTKSLYDNGTPGRGRCGSAATGHPEKWEKNISSSSDGTPSQSSHSNGRKVDKNQGPITPARLDRLRREVAEKISAQRGSIPAGAKRWAEEIIANKLPWDAILRHTLRHAIMASGKVDYTFQRPSRRDTDPIILPGLYKPEVKVCIVVDTSGSISDSDLAMMMGVIDSVLKRVTTDVIVIPCDAQAYEPVKVRRPKDLKGKLLGGGGTDMMKGIRAAIKFKPNVIIVLTDGDTPWNKEAPTSVPVIVVLTQDKPTPAWAKKVVARR
ncbi:MAG: VWA-like domain-containing protein [Candidatus Methanosuratincola sp.]